MKTNHNGNSLKSGIYQIRNLLNGRVYIGSSKEFKSRYRHHLTSLKRGTHHSKFLQNDFDKCGSEAFVFEVLEVVIGSLEEIRSIEQQYIDAKLNQWNECYNSRKNVVLSNGVWSYTPEKTRALKSKLNKERYEDPEYRAKIVAITKALWQDPEYREKTTKAKKSSSAREKMSKSMQTKWDNPEWKDKQLAIIANSNRKEMARLAIVELWKSQDYREKMKDAQASRKKTYEFISPDGEEVTITNMPEFCRNNGLKAGEMYAVASRTNRAKSHKGWTSKTDSTSKTVETSIDAPEESS